MKQHNSKVMKEEINRDDVLSTTNKNVTLIIING
jgi:hypothetical protein